MEQLPAEKPETVGSGWASKVRGALLWAACGDAFGARFEGLQLVNVGELDELMASPPASMRWTDDTALMLALAEHLVRRHGGVNQNELADQFAAEWLRDPARGYGSGSKRLFQKLLNDGERWQQAAPSLFGGQGSAGNGAAMRVAPVGLLPGIDLAGVAQLARRQAVVTHHHPHGQDGAVAQAVAVAIARTSTPGEPVDVDGFIAAVLAHVSDRPGFATVLPELGGVVRQARTPRQVTATLGNDATALGSVPAAVAFFLIHADDPLAALRWAICGGGDTDTIAAMTGAMAGARHGQTALPTHWLSKLEDWERIVHAGTRLAALPSAAWAVVEPQATEDPVERRPVDD